MCDVTPYSHIKPIRKPGGSGSLDECRDQSTCVQRATSLPPSTHRFYIAGDKNGRVPTVMKWGYPNPTAKALIINARSETLLEKETFREDFFKPPLSGPRRRLL